MQRQYGKMVAALDVTLAFFIEHRRLTVCRVFKFIQAFFVRVGGHCSLSFKMRFARRKATNQPPSSSGFSLPSISKERLPFS